MGERERRMVGGGCRGVGGRCRGVLLVLRGDVSCGGSEDVSIVSLHGRKGRNGREEVGHVN